MASIHPFVSAEQVTEVKAHTFNADASDLRWSPGFFPEIVNTDLGNRQPLHMASFTPSVVTYKQQLGCIELVVFND